MLYLKRSLAEVLYVMGGKSRIQAAPSRFSRLCRQTRRMRVAGAFAFVLLGLLDPPAVSGENPNNTSAQGPSAQGGKWISLFDGQTLAGWKSTQFGGEGEVAVENGSIVFDFGASMTGVTYTGKFPSTNYELRWKARKLEGVDFFSAATIPYGDSHCSFINGGWGGSVVGISSIDGRDASENETTQYVRFEDNRWYHFRVRVRPEIIEVWIDKKQVIQLEVKNRRITTRSEVDLSKPLGFSAWETRAHLKDIAYRRLPSGKP